MGWLGTVTGISFKKKGAAPGKAIIIQTLSAGEQERTAEMYHSPGISSMPTENDRVISVPIGTASRVIIAAHNYRIEVEPSSGETIIYSTNGDGSVVKSTIKLDNDGNIDLNGDGKKFVTHAELDTALQTFITALNLHVHATVTSLGTPTPPATPMSLDISASETTTIRTDG